MTRPLLWLVTLVTSVTGLHISVTSNTSEVLTSEDTALVQEEASFYVQCVSEQHFSSNSSLFWNVNTQVSRVLGALISVTQTK